jgi:hypothetical protein
MFFNPKLALNSNKVIPITRHAVVVIVKSAKIRAYHDKKLIADSGCNVVKLIQLGNRQ